METIKNIQSLIAFEKVARLSSYSKAAKELNVSKSHISKLVQQLEDQLGQRLLNRSTRVVKLTEVGERFYQACAASFDHLIKAQNEVIDNSSTPKGKFKITLAGAFGEDTIAPMVARFVKKYPQVQIELNFEHKIVNLLKGSYDFAIRVGSLPDSSLIAKKISTRREYICASKRYLRLHGIPGDPEDLKAHNCLSSKGEWKLLIKNKIQTIKVDGNFKSNNGRSLLNATLNDIGLCCLPGEYVEPHLESGKLVSIMELYTPKEIPIWLLTPSKRNISPAAAAFLKQF